MKTTTNNVAKEILRYKNGDQQNVVIDPVTLSLVISLVEGAIKLVQACNKSAEQATQTAQNISYDEEKQIRQMVKKQLGRWKYFWYGEEYVQAVLQTSKNITLEDMKGLYAEQHTVEFNLPV